MRNLALQPTSGDIVFPSSWSALEISQGINIDLSDLRSQELQHGAMATYDNNKKKWVLTGQGNNFDYATLGIVASKQFGARAIQLPNQTNKYVAGVIDGHELVGLFSAP